MAAKDRDTTETPIAEAEAEANLELTSAMAGLAAAEILTDTPDQHRQDAQTASTKALIAKAQSELESVALDAVKALRLEILFGEGAPRVKAATEVLDRVGISRRQTDTSISFPPEMLAGILGGMAAAFGVRMGESQIAAMRGNLQARHVGAGVGTAEPKPPKPKTRKKKPINIATLKQDHIDTEDDD